MNHRIQKAIKHWKVLCRELDDPDLKIVDIEYLTATKAGDNYLSEVKRMRILMQNCNSDNRPFVISLILKILPKGNFSDYFPELGSFEREGNMYTRVLPKIDQLLKNVDELHEPMFPHCIHHCGNPTDTIYLQDLGPLGFRMVDRIASLNLKQSEMVVQGLAKFHVASLKVQETSHEDFDLFREPCIWQPRFHHIFGSLFLSSMKAMVSAALTWTELDENIKTTLKSMPKKVLDNVYNAYHYNKSHFNVLLHGDCWKNNVMFNAHGFRFLDFQVSNVNAAVLDLLYFIFSSSETDVQSTKVDYLLEVYYNALSSTANVLDVELSVLPSFEEFRAQFIERLFFGFFAFIQIFPITTIDPSEALDINGMLEHDSENKKVLYQTEKFKGAFFALLPFLQQHHIL